MRRSSLTAGLYLLLLFFSGVAVGAFGLHLYTLNSVRATGPRDPNEFRRRYIEELRTRLKLTDEQVNQLGPILDETRRRHRELMDKHRPEMKAIQDEQVSKIRAILQDSQQAEYTKLLDEREKQRQREHPERH
jgi:Spy/CpxP family protein refolding chaperone